MANKQTGKSHTKAGAEKGPPGASRARTTGNSPEFDSVIDVLPAGCYIQCPHCERELRIARKYAGEQVVCNFCSGPFQFELPDRSDATQAYYADCPHCSEEIRFAKKYSGMTVNCKHCGGKLHTRENCRHQVFRLERTAGTLIVVPLGDAKQFRYNDLRVQVNAVLDKSQAADVNGLLIDFGNVVNLSSTMIDAVVKLARNANNAGKQAVFCNASKTIQKTLESKNLDSVWLIYDSRSAAINASKGSLRSSPMTIRKRQ